MCPGIASPRTRVRWNSKATRLTRGDPSSVSIVAPPGRNGSSRSSSIAKVIAATFTHRAVRNGRSGTPGLYADQQTTMR